MDAILRLFRKLGFWLRRERFHDDLAEEMAFHREQAQSELQATGMDAEEARYAAIRQFGNAARLKEESQDLVGFRFETALQDFRYGLRQLRKNPGFTVTASFILALGIGASTAIFSAVSPILFESLPYPDAGRLMMVWESRDGVNTSFPSFGTYHGIAERTQSFEVLAAMKPWQPTMTTAAEPERIEGQRVTSGFFRTLGVAPALGRDFLGSEDIYLGPNVIILSHSVWQRRFASDSAVIGREVKLDGTLFTVIGVMPEGFENVLSPEAEIWAPLQYNSTLPPNSREWGHHLRVVGRLRSGVTRSQAAAELNVILHNLGQAYINGFNEAGGPPRNFLVNRLQDDVTSEVRPVLLAVLGAVLLVLAIACVNVTNLLLARGGRRRGEFAMRSALGAARSRLMRQLLTESLLLGGIGGAFGIAVAYAAVRGLVALSPPGLPRLSDIRLSGFVYLFALGVTTLVGMVVGLVPALQASHSGLHATMQESSRRTAGGHEWTRRALVVAEVSLAVVLLVGAGLLVRTLHRLFSLDTGFDPSHVITMQVQESGPGYRKDEDRLRFFEQALERVRQLPGIEQAAFVNQLPLSGDYEVYGVEFQNDAGNGGTAAFRYAVTPRYFETMRIPLRSGRLFTEQDTAGSAKVALINESLAKRIFAGKDPIGQAFHAGPDLGKPNRPWTTIIGVVADVKHASLQVGSQDSFYTPNSQWAWADTTMTLVARTQGDAATLAPDIRRGIWSIDKDLAIVRVQTMEQIVKASEVQRRFAMTIFEVFALVALVLAATGIYGVLAGSVTERIREIGVRAALGASRGAILALIIRQGMTLTGLGILVGLVGAMAATRALITLLFGISRLDPVTYIGAIALLTGVSGVACAIPAWRAARVDPSIALRAE